MNTSHRHVEERLHKPDSVTPEQPFGPDLEALVRFRDPESGNTWNGFGRPPNWIRGKDRERYRVG